MGMIMTLCFYHDNDLDLKGVKLYPYGKNVNDYQHEAEPNCPSCRKKFPELKQRFPEEIFDTSQYRDV